MKVIHLSDLHLGIRFGEMTLYEDQKYILDEILGIVSEESPQAVIIAGDVYDKAVPSGEAVTLFDDFLVRLSETGACVLIISGNHDSAERIAFGSRLMDRAGVHFSPLYNGNVSPVILKDEYGEAAFYMLPFIKPAIIRQVFPEEKCESYEDAVRIAVDRLCIDSGRRNILITHQFVSGAGFSADRSDSEVQTVGGTDNVSPAIFRDFDYVALGHLHKPQSVSRPTIRYCGTPLKYSFSEACDKKSVTVAEFKEKGNVLIRERELVPLRDVRDIKGTYSQLMTRKNYEGTATGDYIRALLTDERPVINAISLLREVYPNIVCIKYVSIGTGEARAEEGISSIEMKSGAEIFGEFYRLRTNTELSAGQKKLCEEIFERLREE